MDCGWRRNGKLESDRRKRRIDFPHQKDRMKEIRTTNPEHERGFRMNDRVNEWAGLGWAICEHFYSSILRTNLHSLFCHALLCEMIMKKNT